MASAQAFLKYANDTDARFKQWGQGLSNKISIGGFFAQTGDAGQIDWTSNPAHPSAGDRVYYEIWKTVDALSSTSPIYMKIIYGGSTTSNIPVIQLKFGTGSDGAGLLTGNVTTAQDLYTTGAALDLGDTTLECDFAGGPGYFSCLMWRTHSNGSVPQGFVIERALDSSGGYRDAYTTVLLNAGTVSNPHISHIFKPGGGSVKNDQYASTIYDINSSGAYGSNTAVYPIFPMLGLPDNPLTALVCVKPADQTEGATFQMVVYGVTRTYIFTSKASQTGFTPTGAAAAYRFD